MNSTTITYPDEEQLTFDWLDRLRMRYVEVASSQAAPLAVVVAGAPGCDKSVAVTCIRDHIGDCVTIDSGEFLLLHPAYGVLSEQSDELGLADLQAVAAEAAAELLQLAVEQRSHVLMDCCFEDIEAAESLLGYLGDEDYYVIVVIAISHTTTENSEYVESTNQILMQALEHVDVVTSIDELLIVDNGGTILLSTDQVAELPPDSCRHILDGETIALRITRNPNHTRESRFDPKSPPGTRFRGIPCEISHSELPQRSRGPERTQQDPASAIESPLATTDSTPPDVLETRRHWQRTLQRRGDAERSGD